MPSPRFDILYYESTSLGTLCLREREMLSLPGKVVTEVTLDHEMLMSSLHTDSERALGTEALKLIQRSPLKVLIGGLGLGYTAQAVLESDRVATVEVVEYLPPVIEWLQTDMIPLASVLKADERLSVVEGDIYDRLLGAPSDTFDLILIDVDHSPDEQLGSQSQQFYTPEGLKKASKHLAPDGILGVWSYAKHSPFVDDLNFVFSMVECVPITFYNYCVSEECTDWLFLARR